MSAAKTPPNPPQDSTIAVDFTKLETRDAYKLLVGSIVPRPIAFVSTIDANGKTNLAPFSYFNGVCANPPSLVFSVARTRDGKKKDTLLNIEATREFVVNSSSEWHAHELHEASAAYPHGVSEFEKVGLTPIPSTRVKAPRVHGAAIQFECVLNQLVQVGDGGPGSTTLIIGEIVYAHYDPNVYQDGKVLPHALKPIARLGGSSYAKLGEIFDLNPPKIK